jgi:hypothetical protein
LKVVALTVTLEATDYRRVERLVTPDQLTPELVKEMLADLEKETPLKDSPHASGPWSARPTNMGVRW